MRGETESFEAREGERAREGSSKAVEIVDLSRSTTSRVFSFRSTRSSRQQQLEQRARKLKGAIGRADAGTSERARAREKQKLKKKEKSEGH